MKNKTLAVWLTLVVGPFGLHRLYLRGKFDGLSSLFLIFSVAGLYGILRARIHGLDDPISWLFIPWIGFSVACSALTAIVYGLMDAPTWNARFNPSNLDNPCVGQSNWRTVIGVAAALFIGATALLSSIAFSFQRYFEYQASQVEAVQNRASP